MSDEISVEDLALRLRRAFGEEAVAVLRAASKAAPTGDQAGADSASQEAAQDAPTPAAGAATATHEPRGDAAPGGVIPGQGVVRRTALRRPKEPAPADATSGEVDRRPPSQVATKAAATPAAQPMTVREEWSAIEDELAEASARFEKAMDALSRVHCWVRDFMERGPEAREIARASSAFDRAQAQEAGLEACISTATARRRQLADRRRQEEAERRAREERRLRRAREEEELRAQMQRQEELLRRRQQAASGASRTSVRRRCLRRWPRGGQLRRTGPGRSTQSASAVTCAASQVSAKPSGARARISTTNSSDMAGVVLIHLQCYEKFL